MQDTKAFKIDGFIVFFALLSCIVLSFISFFNERIFYAIILGVISMILSTGFTMVYPNETKVITFFGSYIGTIKEHGFWFTIPFTMRTHVSLRVRNFNSDKLKVNDVDGNPIEIAAVVVYKIVDSSKAIFDVEHYSEFVETQSETSLRNIASKYPYDNYQDAISLRGNAEEFAEELKVDLQGRLNVAGVEVIEARLMHLAYAPEIAQAMLQRQQASAIISARQKLVEGATWMVKEAISNFSDENIVKFTEEEKARMVTNLMVAIVSEKGVQPVVDTSSKK